MSTKNFPQSRLRYSDQSKPKYESYNPTVFTLVPSHSFVLDVGCATGALCERLRTEKSCKTVGVELDPRACAQAKGCCDYLVRVDLAQRRFLPFKPSTFDCIVFGDILEHLAQPEWILSQAKTLLKPGGTVIISVPNVTHWRMRLNLLLGIFEYSDYGILDRSHLRFFTSKSLRNFVSELGYEILVFRGHGWVWANTWASLFASAYVVKATPSRGRHIEFARSPQA
jgi:methionine biosynthesis protein MetW